MTTKLPHSTVKRMLVGETGLRANGEAVGAFSEKLVAFAKEESEKIAVIVNSKRRKTIYKEDVEDESEAEEESEESEAEEESEESEDESEESEDESEESSLD